MNLARSHWRWITLLAVLLTAAFFLQRSYTRSPDRGLPYLPPLSAESASHWTEYGGAWKIADGSVVNDSDEPGAKIIAGSPHWQNYSFEADLKLLGIAGNAGLMIRVTDAESASIPTGATMPVFATTGF